MVEWMPRPLEEDIEPITLGAMTERDAGVDALLEMLADLG
jgi:hypothetical protein